MTNKDLVERLRDAADEDVLASVPAMVAASAAPIEDEDLHALAQLAARVVGRAPDAGLVVVRDLIRTGLQDDYAAGYVPSMAAQQREARSLARVAELGRDIVPALVHGIRRDPHPYDERVLEALLAISPSLTADVTALGLRADLDAALAKRVALTNRPKLSDVLWRVSERARQVQRVLDGLNAS